MSINGPVEFVSDRVADTKGATEFGGDSGIIAVGGVVTAGGKVGPIHQQSSSERRGILVRAVGAVTVNADGRVVDDPSGPAIDPLTGARVEDEWNLSGSSVAPVDLPPSTESA